MSITIYTYKVLAPFRELNKENVIVSFKENEKLFSQDFTETTIALLLANRLIELTGEPFSQVNTEVVKPETLISKSK